MQISRMERILKCIPISKSFSRSLTTNGLHYALGIFRYTFLRYKYLQKILLKVKFKASVPYISSSSRITTVTSERL